MDNNPLLTNEEKKAFDPSSYAFNSSFDFYGFKTQVLTNADAINKRTASAFHEFITTDKSEADLKIFTRISDEELAICDKQVVQLTPEQIIYEYNDELRRWVYEYSPFPPFFFEPLRSSFYRLHAACLSLNGQAVILPAAPDTGKTTLTLALLQRGFKLLSDDVTLIKYGDCRIRCFPRSACIHENLPAHFKELRDFENSMDFFIDAEGERVCYVPLNNIFKGCYSEEAIPSKIFFLKRDEGRSVELKPIKKSSAVFGLLRNAVSYHSEDIKKIMDLLSEVANMSETYVLEYGDFKDAADFIFNLMDENSVSYKASC